MWKLVRFLLRLRSELSLTGPLEKRVTVRYVRAGTPHEVTVEGRRGGAIGVELRPHLVVHHPTSSGTDTEGGPITVPLDAVLEIALEEWDLEVPESVMTTRWLRDRRGRFRQIVQS